MRPLGPTQFGLKDALKGCATHAHLFVLVVIQTSEFVTSLRRINAIMKRLKSTSMEVYVKGAPEVMFDIGDRDSFLSKLR